MSAIRSRAVLVFLIGALVTGGCGHPERSSDRRSPDVAGVPLVHGASIVTHVRSCDHGANPYCVLQLVLVGAHYRSSEALLARQELRLREAGWTSTVGDTEKERSADSPGHRLRLSYAIAADDLQSWDLGSIKRRPSVARSLAATMFKRTPALSLMLLTGAG